MSGQVRFGEIGSGVLISNDGKVMTAAHVVHAMNEVTVEFIGNETVPARVVASAPAADLSLLQLDRVPAKVTVSRLADSRSVRVGDQVLVVGAGPPAEGARGRDHHGDGTARRPGAESGRQGTLSGERIRPSKDTKGRVERHALPRPFASHTLNGGG